LAAHADGDSRVSMQIMSWWPEAIGRDVAGILASPFSKTDALLTISREYGFKTWEAVDALGSKMSDPEFETALDKMLSGDAQSLGDMLKQNPALVSQQSDYGHKATLLHYLGANGVESHRQRTPLNAVELAELLLEHGADRSAEANMYGGGQTPLALASTSAHPVKAGVSEALNTVLAA
ncbi:MAG: hypothetical protein AAFW66_09605, partial [Pseudomonadota bacterium]